MNEAAIPGGREDVNRWRAVDAPTRYGMRAMIATCTGPADAPAAES